jgi:hypothetical protein
LPIEIACWLVAHEQRRVRHAVAGRPTARPVSGGYVRRARSTPRVRRQNGMALALGRWEFGQ